jgi:hypothetical protein
MQSLLMNQHTTGGPLAEKNATRSIQLALRAGAMRSGIGMIGAASQIAAGDASAQA